MKKYIVALLAAIGRCSAASLGKRSLPSLDHITESVGAAFGGKGGAPDFDHLRQSVVRIQAVSSSFDWFHPFSSGSDGVGVGTGFVVQTEPYPLFVTNEHVVSDAKDVRLQLLLYGEQQWEADVVSVCSKFDLAILVLRNPEEFKQAMAKRNIVLKSLELSSSAARMGEDVVALGFPLGQDALKISKGNIAGNEEVNQNICIQSTAPISPGNSGGPLMNADGSKVVGVNFAKATKGENINYVIPAWRVQQLVSQHKRAQPKLPENGKWERIQIQVPKADLTMIRPNDALYAMSEGCKQGMYNAKMGPRSFFRYANPPVPENFFLVSVNGIDLDIFGMGLNTKYAADMVSFQDLMFMKPEMSADVTIKTCSKGKVTEHKVPMDWKPEYDRGIRWIQEPSISGMSQEYEFFGDISVMQMTTNHISYLVTQMGDPGPARWLHPDLVSQPRLVINFLKSGSYAATVLSLGSSITKVNGHEVQTLADFRKHLAPESNKQVWTLETDMGKIVALMFNKTLSDQLKEGAQMNAHYLLTPTVVDIANKLGFTQEAGKENLKQHAFLSSNTQLKAHSNSTLPVRAAGPLEVHRVSDGERGRVTVDASASILALRA